jgi:hypothetical protein
MPRVHECPKCGVDIGDSYQGAEPDVGIGGGWYCDACDLAVGDEDGPEPHDDDVQVFGTVTGRLISDKPNFEDADPVPAGRPCACGVPYEAGYGLAGGGVGPYMYCPSCAAVLK